MLVQEVPSTTQVRMEAFSSRQHLLWGQLEVIKSRLRAEIQAREESIAPQAAALGIVSTQGPTSRRAWVRPTQICLGHGLTARYPGEVCGVNESRRSQTEAVTSGNRNIAHETKTRGGESDRPIAATRTDFLPIISSTGE